MRDTNDVALEAMLRDTMIAQATGNQPRFGLAVHAARIQGRRRPLPEFNEAAFEAALDAFHRALRPAGSAEERDEVFVEALLAFLAVYTERAW